MGVVGYAILLQFNENNVPLTTEQLSVKLYNL